MTAYTCKLELNNAEMSVVAAALEAFIRDYDQKNRLQPWNKGPRELAKDIKRRMQRNAVAVITAPPAEGAEAGPAKRPPVRGIPIRHKRHR